MTATTPDPTHGFARVVRRPRVSLLAYRQRLRRPDVALGAVAAVLFPLGLLLIIIGWYGASHTPYLFEQVPYLISGGLLGVALVAGAGLCYFGSWIARSAQQQREASAELASLLREVRDELAARPLTIDAPRTPASSSFVATGSGSMVHRRDCAVVVGREDVRAVPTDGGGLRACRLCNPFEDPA